MAVFWTTLTSASAVATAEPAVATLKIFLYDYASLERGLTQRSIDTAAQALLRSGLPSVWERCGVSEQPREAGCQGRAGSMVIQMRLQVGRHGKKLGRRAHEFGYAVVPEGGLGVIAGVYVDQARRLSREQGYGFSLILGHAMAHEIGHLLLGMQSHSRTGLMTRVWKDRELRLASTGLLHFTQEQSHLMQQQISVRSGRTDASRVLTDSGHAPVGAYPNYQAENLPLSPIPFRSGLRRVAPPTRLRQP